MVSMFIFIVRFAATLNIETNTLNKFQKSVAKCCSKINYISKDICSQLHYTFRVNTKCLPKEKKISRKSNHQKMSLTNRNIQDMVRHFKKQRDADCNCESFLLFFSNLKRLETRKVKMHNMGKYNWDHSLRKNM